MPPPTPLKSSPLPPPSPQVTRSPILPHKTSPGSRLVRVAITSKETCLYKSMLVSSMCGGRGGGAWREG